MEYENGYIINDIKKEEYEMENKFYDYYKKRFEIENSLGIKIGINKKLDQIAENALRSYINDKISIFSKILNNKDNLKEYSINIIKGKDIDKLTLKVDKDKANEILYKFQDNKYYLYINNEKKELDFIIGFGILSQLIKIANDENKYEMDKINISYDNIKEKLENSMGNENLSIYDIYNKIDMFIKYGKPFYFYINASLINGFLEDKLDDKKLKYLFKNVKTNPRIVFENTINLLFEIYYRFGKEAPKISKAIPYHNFLWNYNEIILNDVKEDSKYFEYLYSMLQGDIMTIKLLKMYDYRPLNALKDVIYFLNSVDKDDKKEELKEGYNLIKDTFIKSYKTIKNKHALRNYSYIANEYDIYLKKLELKLLKKFRDL